MNSKIKLQVCLMRCLHALLPLDHRKIVFCSFSGGSYSDNPKAISERLHELYPSARQVWLFNDPKEKQVMLPHYLQGVKRWSLRALCELATSRVWVFNDTQPCWAYKGKNQVYIQTWHGDRGFKKILNDYRPRTKKDQLPEAKTCDLAIAGSDFGESVFRSAFRYTGTILKTGTPRNDKLVDIDVKAILQKKNELHLDGSCKYLLYAPTLRSKALKTKQDQEMQRLDLMEVLASLEMSTGKKWKVLVRAHNKVVGLSGIPESEKILDVSHYEDMADLLQVSDILISDYSSSVGDFALTNRPIVLFQDDREKYLEQDRTFYFDLDTSPFWIARSQNDLVSILYDLPNRDSKENCQEILSFYKTHESGHACEDVSRFIIEKIC